MPCAVFGCNSDNQSKHFRNDIKFYSFPRDNVTRQLLWVISCCRSDSFTVKNARVCSQHFSENDFERNLQHELLNYLPKKG